MRDKKREQPEKVIPDEELLKLYEDGLLIEQELYAKNKSPYSDDFCCKVLAYTLCFGGGNEQVIYNHGLHFAIKVAQQRLRIYGGEVPNVKLLPLFKKYVTELSINGSKVAWLDEIKKYKVSIPDYDSLPEYLPSEKNNSDKAVELNSILLLLLLPL